MMGNKDCNPLPVTSGADSHITSDEDVVQLRERITELEAEVERRRTRVNKLDEQLVWLADWCRERTGIESNDVIGKDGWPAKLVEVVAQAIEQATSTLEWRRERSRATHTQLGDPPPETT